MTGDVWAAADADVAALEAARHNDPFRVLGPHSTPAGMVLRAFVPGATHVEAIRPDGHVLIVLVRRGDTPLFEGLLPGQGAGFAYQFRARNADASWEFADPYGFGPALGPLDDHLLVEGTHRALYDRLGAHIITHEGVAGVLFALWAPHAGNVSVVGDFNQWDGRRHPMRKRIDSGLWELFLPDLREGTVYKFHIVSAEGVLLPLKADPFGFGAERRPSTASVVARTDNFIWHDAAWLAARDDAPAHRRPVSIFEVHPGSWRRGEAGDFLTYDELADQLIPYVVDLGFTHLELMPINEHPLDASWGYQPIGLFAPTRRFGDPAGFARFVDRAHQAGLGIILDWVPAHFPTDAHGLARFDGTALYEHADPRRGFHPDWNTAIYDFGRREVSNILAANALYWLECFHIDGLRVDAVASMLYLDYSRKDGEWLPNEAGGNQNLEAKTFLQQVNALAYAAHPGVMMIAEESTSWPGVTHPTSVDGLGFGFKWNMGWMNDSLAYMALDPVHRRWHHDRMTFGLLYAFTENFVLPISHDEVVHGKGSLIGKMPGDEWQKFANLRAYYGFMWGHPGKKLLFMGQEFGQTREWNFDAGLEWHLTQYAPHRGLMSLIRDLNRLYRTLPALHARDNEPEGFAWIVVDDAQQSVFAWLRLAGQKDTDRPEDRPVVVVTNFSPVPRTNYRIGLPYAGRWREVLNTDAQVYGGSGMGNSGAIIALAEPAKNYPASADILVPPLASVYFVFEPD